VSYVSHQESQVLTDKLITLAERAYWLRDMSTVQDVGLILTNLPMQPAREIGPFYRALSLKRSGKKDEARILLESVVESAQRGYRARAIQTLGTIRHEQGDLADALKLYLMAAKTVPNRSCSSLLPNLMAQLQVCFIKSDIGDHKGALKHLHSLLPLVLHIAKESPIYFFLYHNALAVEFAETNQIVEAQRACEIALASPFAHAYPEWSATRDEIAAKGKTASHSVTAVPRAENARPAPQVRPQHVHRAARAVDGCTANVRISVQRPIFEFPAKQLAVSTAAKILDRMLSCCGPRAPPLR
jgi:tetratricopeptide (TPR) repeat protein